MKRLIRMKPHPHIYYPAGQQTYKGRPAQVKRCSYKQHGMRCTKKMIVQEDEHTIYVD